jgi:hypothetical protein
MNTMSTVELRTSARNSGMVGRLREVCGIGELLLGTLLSSFPLFFLGTAEQLLDLGSCRFQWNCKSSSIIYKGAKLAQVA